MNNLNTNCERILEVLREISKEQLLTYQRRQPKLSDIELISLSVNAEFIVKMTCLEHFQNDYHQKQNVVFTIEDNEN